MTPIRRAASVAFFRRDALFSISLDHRATADAALLVSGVAVAGHLWNVVAGGSFSFWALLATAINSVMVWIVMAGLTFLVGKLVCQTQTPVPAIMRLQGYAYLPLLAPALFPDSLLALACRVWFLVLLVYVTAEALETNYLRAAVTVGGSLVGLYVVGQLLWGGRLF